MTEPVSDQFEFDVFLCYNSEDRPEVEQIASQLERQGIKLWLDVREIPPGQRWQNILERRIQQVRSAAVFIGNNGLGPWQDQEKELILQELNTRERSIIPVLLSTASQQPSLPGFLKNRMYVDFRQSAPDPMKQLIWGITGNKPTKKRKFLTIYSYNDEDERTDNSTVIVLPAFDMEKVEVTNQSTSNTLKQKALENLSRADTKAAIRNDVVAGLFITSSFTRNWLPIPQLCWDQEEINFKDRETRTHILIGLSNSQLDILNNEIIPGKYFSIDTVREKNNFNSFIIKCCRIDSSNNPCSIDQWRSYTETRIFDYAVFAKFEFGNKKIIVCGGITEEGTNRAASYVSENWEYIYSRLSDEKGDTLDPNDSFAVIIEFLRDEQSNNFEIERLCIKRKIV